MLQETDGKAVVNELGRSRTTVSGAHRTAVLITALLTAALLIIPFVPQPAAALSSEMPTRDLGVAPTTPPADVRPPLGPGWNHQARDWAAIADEQGYVDVIFWLDNHHSPASTEFVSASAKNPDMASELMRRFKSEERRVFSTAFDGFSASVSLEDLNEWFSIGSDGVQVYPDIRMRAMLSESVYQIGADQVWSMHDLSGNSVRGTGIVVAVIDTGVDYRHPDLGGGIGPGYKVIGGYDFYNGDSDPMDDHGHGTHVAGIIAANGGITGVAPDASILAYKVLGMDGSGLMSDVIAAIEAAMDPNGDGDTRDHADIISMSLGGAGSEDDPVCLAVEAAVEAGIVVVVAAGNSGPGMGTVASPGVAPYAITVGAVDGEWRLAPFSSRGTGVDLKIKPEISAPGVDIVSTVPFSGTQLSSPTGYMALSGTSMATPHVSGVAALLVQMNPTWSPEQVKSAIVTEALDIDESLWHAGAGGLWAPGSIAADLFSGEPVVSYGFSTSPPHNVSVTNTGVVSSFALGSLDWLSLYSNGSSADSYWANLTDVSPSSMRLALGGSGEFSLSISVPEANVPEGYYEGFVVLSDGSRSLRVAFGYAVLSQVNVHVVDLSGREVFDPYGGVWIYSLPTATASFGRRAENSYAPPASFLIPSGEYSVHAAGHQLIYHYSDPYLLSKTFTLERHQMLDIYLQMSEARVMSLNLTAENGLPIYVKDYRVYARYAGDVNVSFDLVGSDYAITSKDFSTLKKSCNVFVSDTMATVGISIAGFSFTSDMWDFVARNQDHWYEHPGSSFTGFSISAIADVQYLLAWEFDGVNGITSLALELDSTRASRYVTKYDVPGVIGNVWGDWGRSLAMGGQAAFFIRRNTQTSLNPFYAGTTRTIIVQGVFSELYYPGNLFEGTYTQHLYDPDYSHRVGVDGMPGIFLPDRYSLRPIEGGYFVQRVGVGPFYPSVKTQNSNDTLVLFHPLLRDQAGLEVSGAYVPYMNLYLNGHLKGIYQLSEFTARRNAIRYTNLEGVGFYTAEISYQPTPDICNDVKIVLGFAVPSEDCDPPQIAGLEMPQCFVPGSTVPIGVRAFDSSGIQSMEVSWRSSGSVEWQSVAVVEQGPGNYTGQIQSLASDRALDLRLRVSDSRSNYIEYVAANATLAQVPISFSLWADPVEIGYRNGDAFVVLRGHLVDGSGSPLSKAAAVPLELMLGDIKKGVVLDEYVADGSHAHNGTILFEWHFNPVNIFPGPNQTAEITAAVDLGVYEPVTQKIILKSTWYSNMPPMIVLESPGNGSIIRSGEIIDLDIVDDGLVSVEAYLDGTYLCAIQSPWRIDTSSWADGQHTLRVVATDEDGAVSSAVYDFGVDAAAPYVRILYPSEGSRIPARSDLAVEVRDLFLDCVVYSLDGSPSQVLSPPYVLPMDTWSPGDHVVFVTATDLVGQSTTVSVSFQIAPSTIVIELISPSSGAVIRSGIPIEFSVVGEGNVSCRWSEDGLWTKISGDRRIPTDGWAEGVHALMINATSDLGGWDEIGVVVVIDDTRPNIALLSPGNLSFVDHDDVVSIRILDDNFASVHWYLWGVHWSSARPDVAIPLNSSPSDGYFSVEVEAYDFAGNGATATFVFAMDSAAPMIALEGLSGGDAIGPGQGLRANVEDVFLTVVRASLDGADPSILAFPYIVNTTALSSGWHELRLVADDASGKSSTKNFRFYLDVLAPSVRLLSGRDYSSNSSLEVLAEVVDDHALRSVKLCYELVKGSYGEIPMWPVNGNYSATLGRAELWDGMMVYVMATDSVGNVGISEALSLRASQETPGSSDLPIPPSDGEMVGGRDAFLMIVLLASVTASVVVMFLIFRLRHHRRKRDGDLPVGEEPVAKEQLGRTEVSGPDALNGHAVAHDLADGSRFKSAAEFGVTAPRPAAAGASRNEKRAALIDAIPAAPLLVSSNDRSQEPGDDVDYGDLIQRELIIPYLAFSLYGMDSGGERRLTPEDLSDPGQEEVVRKPPHPDPTIPPSGTRKP